MRGPLHRYRLDQIYRAPGVSKGEQEKGSLKWYEPRSWVYEPLVMFDEADDVVFFGGSDQGVVMIEGLYGRLGYQNVDAPVGGIGGDVVMGI